MAQPVSFVTFPQLANPNLNVAIVPAQVASLQRVPGNLLVPPTTDGTIVTFEDGTEVGVVGTVNAVGAALAAAAVGSSLVLRPSLADPAVNLAIQGARVSALLPVPAQLLVPPTTDGTRIVYEDGTERTVVGTVAATAAALVVAPPAPPSTLPNWLRASTSSAMGVDETTAAAFAPIPGAVITTPAGFTSSCILSLGGTGESTNAAASGGAIRVTKNGGAIGRTLQWGPGQFAANGIPAMGLGAMGLQLLDGTVPGDLWGIEIACVPGGGADIFRTRDACINLARFPGP